MNDKSQYESSSGNINRLIYHLFFLVKITYIYIYLHIEQKLSALSESLHNQYATLMSVAGKVAFLHENVEKLKQKYLNFMKTNFLEDTNPFTQQNQQY